MEVKKSQRVVFVYHIADIVWGCGCAAVEPQGDSVLPQSAGGEERVGGGEKLREDAEGRHQIPYDRLDKGGVSKIRQEESLNKSCGSIRQQREQDGEENTESQQWLSVLMSVGVYLLHWSSVQDKNVSSYFQFLFMARL